MQIFERLLASGPEKVIDGIAYTNDEPIALVSPSLIFGKDNEGAYYVSGPKKNRKNQRS